MAERSKRFQSAVLLLALALLIFLFTAITLSFLPQDLSDIEGRKEDATAEAPSRNLQRVLANAAEQDIKVTLSEEEVNQWLFNQLKGKQDGMLKDTVSYRGTWIRFKEGSVEIIFEREAFNRLHTIAMNVEIEQLIVDNNRMESSVDITHGRLGQMPVPEGYLFLVMSSYRALAAVMEDEVASLTEMLQGKATIEFQEGQVTFTPRSITTNPSLEGF